MSNETLQALPTLALLLQLAVLGWRLWRRDVAPMMVLNGIAAIGLAVPLGVGAAQGPDGWAEGFYPSVLGLFAFEVTVLATSIGWVVHRSRTLGVLAGVEFAVNLLLTIAVLVFVMTFRIDRLI